MAEKSGDATASGCLVILALLAYWSGGYPRLSPRDKHNSREAVPWLVVASVVFAVRAVAQRIKQ